TKEARGDERPDAPRGLRCRFGTRTARCAGHMTVDLVILGFDRGATGSTYGGHLIVKESRRGVWNDAVELQRRAIDFVHVVCPGNRGELPRAYYRPVCRVGSA